MSAQQGGEGAPPPQAGGSAPGGGGGGGGAALGGGNGLPPPVAPMDPAVFAMLDHSTSTGPIIGVCIMCMLLAATAVTLRVYTRQFLLNRVGPDDFMAVAALTGVIALGAITIIHTNFGLGSHIYDIAMDPLLIMDFFKVRAAVGAMVASALSPPDPKGCEPNRRETVLLPRRRHLQRDGPLRQAEPVPAVLPAGGPGAALSQAVPGHRVRRRGLDHLHDLQHDLHLHPRLRLLGQVGAFDVPVGPCHAADQLDWQHPHRRHAAAAAHARPVAPQSAVASKVERHRHLQPGLLVSILPSASPSSSALPMNGS